MWSKNKEDQIETAIETSTLKILIVYLDIEKEKQIIKHPKICFQN